MKPEHQKYILDNIGRKSVKQIAQELHLKERKVRFILEKEKQKPQHQKTEEFVSVVSPPLSLSVWVFFLFVIGFLVYSNTLRAAFQFDDNYTIVNNPAVRNLTDFNALWNAFNTRFVVGVTFALNYAFGKLNVSGYHLFNICVHILSALSVLFLVKLTFKTPLLRDHLLTIHADLIAVSSSLLFLVHPVQTQAVSYVWQRSTSLATLFYLLSIVFYIRARLGENKLSYIISLSAVVAGMFTKEITFTLPLMIVLYEFFFFGHEELNTPKRLRVLAPFLSTLFIIPMTLRRAHQITISLMKSDVVKAIAPGGDESIRLSDMTRWVGEETMKRSDYLFTQLNVVRTYFRLLFLPVRQNLDYDYPLSHGFDIPTLLSLLFLIGVLYFAVRIFLRHRMISFGLFWIFLAMSVESLVVQNDVIYEHRLYLPMAGFALFFTSSLFLLCRSRKVFILSMSLILMVLSGACWRRNEVWKTEYTLWQDVIQKSPNKARGYYNLGLWYDTKGEEDKAIEYYNKANECDMQEAKRRGGKIYPDAAMTYNNLANIYRERGNVEETAKYYQESLKVGTRQPKIYMNLANLKAQAGRRDEAIALYQKAMELDPNDAQVRLNLGVVYLEMGKKEEAIQSYTKAIECDPKMAEAYNNLGSVYFSMGNKEEAERCYRKAVELKPDFKEAHANLRVVRGS